MLWHRQAIFKSKGDKLCSSAECRIWTRDPRHQIASRLNARWQTNWAIQDQAKNLNSTARPYDQRAFSPLDPTVSWLSHLFTIKNIYLIIISHKCTRLHLQAHIYCRRCGVRWLQTGKFQNFTMERQHITLSLYHYTLMVILDQL